MLGVYMDAGSRDLRSARPLPGSPPSRGSRDLCADEGSEGASAGGVAQASRGGDGGGTEAEGAGVPRGRKALSPTTLVPAEFLPSPPRRVPAALEAG